MTVPMPDGVSRLLDRVEPIAMDVLEALMAAIGVGALIGYIAADAMLLIGPAEFLVCVMVIATLASSGLLVAAWIESRPTPEERMEMDAIRLFGRNGR